MNNKYYGNTTLPNTPIYNGTTVIPNMQNIPSIPPATTPINTNNIEVPFEQSYIENILRINKGKKVEVYMSFADSIEWRDRKFNGIIEQSGRDHIILSDPVTGAWYLLLMIYVDYIKFDEPINYNF